MAKIKPTNIPDEYLDEESKKSKKKSTIGQKWANFKQKLAENKARAQKELNPTNFNEKEYLKEHAQDFIPNKDTSMPTGDYLVTGGTQGMSGNDIIQAEKDAEKANEVNSKVNTQMSTEMPELKGMKERKEAEAEATKEQIQESAEELNKVPDSEIQENIEKTTEALEEENPSEAKRYDASTKSIWQAYLDGDISKETRNYLIVDTLATFAKNTGRNIGNVGAQYSGGSIDNTTDQSIWDKRQEALANEEIAGEKEHLGGPADRQRQLEELKIQYTPAQYETAIESAKKAIEAAGINIETMKDKRTALEAMRNSGFDKEHPYLFSIMANTSTGLSDLMGILSGAMKLVPGM